MAPVVFATLVEDLLSEQCFITTVEVDAQEIFSQVGGNAARLTVGDLPHRFEVKLQISNEFFPDSQTGYQREGESAFVHGPCAVLVHSMVSYCLDRQRLSECLIRLKAQGARQLLAFVNGNMLVEDMHGYCGHVYMMHTRSRRTQCTWKTWRTVSASRPTRITVSETGSGGGADRLGSGTPPLIMWQIVDCF